MACIKSAQRAAQTALAPDAPYLAAGTMTGAIDLSFSNSANIEIFRLDFQSDSPDLPLLASAPSPDRFNRLSWSRPGAVEGDSFALGLLAGGLSDGSVAVWNPLSMISSEGKAEDAMVARLEKHTGPVCGLEFSELTPNRLASGAEQGELCIWDLKNPVEPIVYPPLKWCFLFHGKRDAILRAYGDPSMLFAIPDGMKLSDFRLIVQDYSHPL